jgi:diguanylate cyclase (GGDEF)-like protein
MERIMGLGIKKSYLYLFDEPIRHTRYDICRLPEKMYLAASQNGKHVSSFRKDARPCITREQGLAMLFCGTRAFQIQVYVLFSGEMQYGILVTDVPIDDIPLAYLASMQISNSLRFYEMSLAQRRTRSKLERLVEEINEKNEVLNFISGNDVMTGCLNRRGFMEAAVRMNKDNKGESAALIFLDLDHLKEINDFFGHKEGDFAIVTVASTFLKAVSEHGIVGRIGGDEFVAMVLEKDRKTGEIIRFVREQNDLFNKCMEKPYYVEASMGVRRFVCSESMVLSEVLDKADAALYRQKKERRKTIRREIPV